MTVRYVMILIQGTSPLQAKFYRIAEPKGGPLPGTYLSGSVQIGFTLSFDPSRYESARLRVIYLARP